MALLTDGFSCTISFPAFPGILFREKETQPPDLDGGGAIDTTTMRNTRFRTKQPKSLLDLGPIVLQIQYDPANYAAAVLPANMQSIILALITFPDLSALSVMGWIDKFKPGSTKEGDFHLAELTFIPSNQTSPAAGAVETPPVFLPPPTARPAATA